MQKEKMKNRDDLQDFVKRNNYAGLEDITDEEFEGVQKYTPRVALNMISKRRQGIDKVKEYETWKGIVLGARDFIWKGIQIEDAKSQYISVLMSDENERVYLAEVSAFGHLKGVSHGDATEMNIEIKEAILKDKSTRINRTIRDKDNMLPILKAKAVQNYNDIKDSGLYIYDAGEIVESNLYDVVALEGVVSNVDACPIWSKTEDGVRVGDYPINYNDQACLQMTIKSDGPTRIRVNLNPKKFSDLFISWPEDFSEIIKSNDVQSALAAMVDAKLLVVGCIRKFDMSNNGNYATLDATAVFVPDEIYADSDASKQTTIEDSTTEEPITEEKPPAAGSEVAEEEKPAEKEKPATDAKSKMEMYKEYVSELMDTLDKDDLSIEDVQNAHILPEDLSPTLITGIINAVKKSRSK